MSYNRKQFDKQKLKKLAKTNSAWTGGGSYYDSEKCRYIRFWKSHGKTSIYSLYKKRARKKARKYAMKYGFWNKKADDLWWNVW